MAAVPVGIVVAPDMERRILPDRPGMERDHRHVLPTAERPFANTWTPLPRSGWHLHDLRIQTGISVLALEVEILSLGGFV